AKHMFYGAKIIMNTGKLDFPLGWIKESPDGNDVTLVISVTPPLIKGQKTAAFEIVDKLGDAPDMLFIPVGNAGNITAYWKGFREYQDLGRSQTLPRMMGFQAEGAAPIVRGEVVTRPQTIASAIRIGNPATWNGALEARDGSGGVIDSVSDDEILEAYRLLANKEGIFCEPASAASFAGLMKMHRQGMDLHDKRIVCICTGNGLKDPDLAVSSSGGQTIEVQANIEALEAATLGSGS
ncbi:MAG: pyridoxal-phosphate dependent enzyme, partial [Chloroflexi bacterium]|nr:pyridoxal-phosphate dependent enzyme [Chloroflexota bacterium]